MPDLDRAASTADSPTVEERAPWRSGQSESDARRGLLFSSSMALAIKLGAAGLGYAMLVALSLAMTESDYGRFAFGFTLATVLAVVASQGLHTAVLRFWPQYKVQDQPELAWGFVRWGGRSTLASSTAIALGLVVVGIALDIGGTAAGAVFGAAALVIPLALAEYVANALRSTGAMVRALAPRDILWRAMVCAFGFAAAGTELGAAPALFVLAALLAVIVGGQWFALNRRGGAVVTRDDPTERHLWVSASRVMWASAVVYVLARNVDVLLLGVLRSDGETGSYFAAQRSAQLLGLMLVAANMVAVPLISKHFYSDDRTGLQRMLTLVAVGVSIPTLIMLGAMVVFAGRLMALFDASYRSDSAVLILLATGAAINAMAGPTGYVLEMVGQHRAHLRLMMQVYATAFAIQLAMVPLVGVLGAAVPALLAAVAWNMRARRIALDEVGVDPTVLSVIPYLRRRMSQ